MLRKLPPRSRPSRLASLRQYGHIYFAAAREVADPHKGGEPMMAVVTHYAVGELTEKSGTDGAPAYRQSPKYCIKLNNSRRYGAVKNGSASALRTCSQAGQNTECMMKCLTKLRLRRSF